MSSTQISFLVFGIVLSLAIGFDLGLLSKKGAEVTIRKALGLTIFWVALAFAFFGFLWIEKGHTTALEYISAYLIEWSLSIDNIFVFLLIFSYFNVSQNHRPRVLLIGILMAIFFRIIFITIGVVLVSNFEWILYIFGAFLVFTGLRIFTAKKGMEYDINNNMVYKWLNRFFHIEAEDKDGKFIIKKYGRRFITALFVVIILLATADIVFAVDSIPAVFAITQNKLVLYSSNIFAVLGLRSLFFLIQGAINKFQYLQQGIAVVLVIIGLKMLTEDWLLNKYLHLHRPTQVFISLGVIVICISGSIIYSILINRKRVG